MGERADPGERPDQGEVGGVAQSAGLPPARPPRPADMPSRTVGGTSSSTRSWSPRRASGCIAMTAYLLKRLVIGAAHAARRLDRRLRRARSAAGRSGAADARHERRRRMRSRRCASSWASTSRLSWRYLAWVGGLLTLRFRPLLHLFRAGHRPGRRARSSCRCRWRSSRCSCRPSIAIPGRHLRRRAPRPAGRHR